MSVVVILIAIFLSIALGYITKINTGIFAIAFSYLIGCFMLNYTTKQIVVMWPLSLFFIIFSVSLFYNFAIVNGTLEKLAKHLLYKFKKYQILIPFIIYFVSVLISGMGAGFFAVVACLAPLSLMICDKTGDSKVLGGLVVSYGALTGGNIMTSLQGVVFKGLIEKTGLTKGLTTTLNTIFFLTMVISLILIAGTMAITRRNKKQNKIIEIEKPEPFTKKQKINLYLIAVLILIVMVPAIIHMFVPTNATFKFINDRMDVGFVAVVLSVVCMLLKLGDKKQVIAKIPWNTIIMICGVGMLIEIAIKAGIIKLIASWLSSSIPTFLIPVTLAIVAGVMCFFSSTLGVVTPALFPIVPALSASTGISPLILFTCIVAGAQSTGALSPFSSGGSLTLGACSNDEERSELFPKLMFVATPCIFATAIVVCFIFSLIFK